MIYGQKEQEEFARRREEYLDKIIRELRNYRPLSWSHYPLYKRVLIPGVNL